MPYYLRELSKAIGTPTVTAVAKTQTEEQAIERCLPERISGMNNQITGPYDKPNTKVNRITKYF